MHQSVAVSLEPQTQSLAEYLRRARSVLVYTGPAISAPQEGGRQQARWAGARRPIRLAEFLENEEARCEYWDARLAVAEATQGAAPNDVHRSLVALERAGRLRLVATQNVDGLQAAAGLRPEHLVELHGTEARTECLACGERSDPLPHLEAYRATRRPPRCHCGGWLKIATMSFGLPIRQEEFGRAERAAAECDLVVSLGSTLCVRPASSIPLMAAHRGVPYVIVHHGYTDHDDDPAVTLRLNDDPAAVFVSAVRDALATH